MTDLLIREVPDDVLTAIDVRAKRLGLSRSEYLRRALAREAAISELAVTSEALQRFSESSTSPRRSSNMPKRSNSC
jgi:plasmid stability protein